MEELLEPADCQRILTILDTAAGAVGRVDFFDQIQHALARHLGWHGAGITGVPVPFRFQDWGGAGDGKAGRRTLENPGVLVGVVDGRPAGQAVIRVRFPDGTEPGARETAILSRLQRHLAPWLREHFARVRAQRLQADLTGRERTVALLVAQGMSNRQAAEHLTVSVGTVKKHLARAMAKTGCTSRTQLALQCLWVDQAMDPPAEAAVRKDGDHTGGAW